MRIENFDKLTSHSQNYLNIINAWMCEARMDTIQYDLYMIKAQDTHLYYITLYYDITDQEWKFSQYSYDYRLLKEGASVPVKTLMNPDALCLFLALNKTNSY